MAQIVFAEIYCDSSILSWLSCQVFLSSVAALNVISSLLSALSAVSNVDTQAQQQQNVAAAAAAAHPGK